MRWPARAGAGSAVEAEGEGAVGEGTTGWPCVRSHAAWAARCACKLQRNMQIAMQRVTGASPMGMG